MGLLYQIFIHLLHLFIRVASLFHRKAGLFIRGRKNILEELKGKISQHPNSAYPLAWFHCASLGEFEQVRPLIEQIKSKNEKIKILITFFSPSGYEVRKNYEGADFVFYLPVDTRSNVKRFLDIVNPALVFFVKYDFWYNYLSELYRRKIPAYLVSANFRAEQFRGIYGKYLMKVLGFFTTLFVQNHASEKILQAHGIQNVTVSGDLRYDKVSQTALKPKKVTIAEYFKGNSRIVIGGSTWAQDNELLAQWQLESGNSKLIIAPHEINEEGIEKIISLFLQKPLRFSEISKEPVSSALDKLHEARVLLIDNIGMLSHLYRYADIAYIGGGFGAGIHNILEAVAFGVPVIFGPNYEKFPEAKELIERGGGFTASNATDLTKTMALLLSDDTILKTASLTCRNFVMQRKGATEKILSRIVV